MKVAIVHDDLVQWGGAERMLLAISEVFHDAPIYTSVFDKNNSTLWKNFGEKDIRTSFLQNTPQLKKFYKLLLPLYPIAFEQIDFSEYDLVISQTTRFAKAIITKPETKHICYCHTPPRFLWNYSGEKTPKIFNPYFNFLRKFDQISANRVDKYLAGSGNAKQRIKDIYKQDSEVLYPFVDLEKFENLETFDGGYYLIIARLNKYKKVDVAIKAFNKSGERLKIVGVGPQLAYLKSISNSNVEFLESVDEDILLNLIAGCKALIVCGEEDFGLTPLEAQAAGKPVIAYKKGGSLETVIENKTGVFFENQTVESLIESFEKLDRLKIKPEDCKNNAEQFSKQIFKKQLLKLTAL